jgi:hypothetical protein
MSKEKFELNEKPDLKNFWYDGKKKIPMKSMTKQYLQNAMHTAQRKELYYHNRSLVFSDLVAALEEEAANRGIKLKDLDTKFHKEFRRTRNTTLDTISALREEVIILKKKLGELV